MKRLPRILAVLCALSTGVGCLTLTIRPSEYTPMAWFGLDVTAELEPLAEPLPWSLDVQPFSAPPRYGERILHRTSAHTIEFDEYCRWIESPPDLVADAFLEACLHAKVCQRVTFDRLESRADMVLVGRVLSFDDVRDATRAGAGVVECSVHLELMSGSRDAVVWSATLAARAPKRDRSPASIAAAMSSAVRQIFLDAVTEWQALAKEQKNQSASKAAIPGDSREQ